MANKFQATAMLCFLVSLFGGRVIFSFATLQFPWIVLEILAVVPILILCTFGAIYLFLASQTISKHHTIFSALIHFCLSYLPLFLARKRLKFIRSCCKNPRGTQEKCLKEIITCNKNTEYGVKFRLKDISCLKDFQGEHPLTSYGDYEQYVQRIANGEKNVTTAAKVSRLILTSGTTGESKWIPMNMDRFYYNFITANAILYESFPDLQLMQKTFRLHCNSRIGKSNCGLTIAGAMVLEKDLVRHLVSFSTPPDGYMIENKEEAFYVHFLFGLRERNLATAMALFASMFVDGFKYLEIHWPRIVEDLANGTLNSDLNLPTPIRESLTRALGSGDPERAEEVRRECEKGQQGIMKRLWPRMRCLLAVDNTGIRDMVMKTIGEGLLMFSPVYASSELLVGININPFQKGQEEFLLSFTDFIYEFIPEEDIDKASPRVFLIDEVEIGRNYELVITQMWGLYRYRMGDVIQVSGFYQNCPTIKFMYRTGTLLNLFGEKVDQVTLVNSLNTALSKWIDVNALRHYCVAESTLLSGLLTRDEGTEESSHYVFFLELTTSDKNRSDSARVIDLTKLAQQIDENIHSRHAFYRVFKDTGQISPSKVYLVKPGSFDKLKTHILANSAATEIQFKMPKKIRTRGMAEVMLENIRQWQKD